MKRYLYYILTLNVLIGFTSCEDRFESIEVKNAEALKQAAQLMPANNAALQLNAGTPEETVLFSWLAAKAGLGSEVTYHVLFDRKGGDFSAPLARIQADNEGKDQQLLITQQQLNDLVQKAGTHELAWKVESSVDALPNSTISNSLFAYNISVKPFGVGISKFAYLAPTVNKKLLLDKINSPNGEVVFDWEDAVSSDNSAVTYRFLVALPLTSLSQLLSWLLTEKALLLRKPLPIQSL